MPIEEIHHVQLAMPSGGEAAARVFYSELLGVPEVPKPRNLLRAGGVWFENGAVRLHVGVDPAFHSSAKAHVALLVSDLAGLVQTLRDAGCRVVDDERLKGYFRVYAFDPFGNRIELMESQS
jgi:catechol 2,3-dioxygenase-like lactoylglutathione lyase family enzyme